MGEDPIAILRHDILGHLTVVKNALSFIIEGHTGKVPEEMKKFLNEAYKRNEDVIQTVIATREQVPPQEPTSGGTNNG